jgi:hypothetical protein
MDRHRTLSSRLLPCIAAGLLTLTPVGLAAAPGRYVGKTAQGKRVSLQVNRGATRVRSFRIRYRVRCRRTRLDTIFTFRYPRIRRNRFVDSGSTQRTLRDGTRLAQRVRVAGRFTSRREAAGRWTARVTVTRERTVVCSVEGLRWRARR